MRELFSKSIQAREIINNPSLEQLREMAKEEERTTEFKSPSFISETRNRSAKFTKNLIDDDFTEEDWQELAKAQDSLKDEELIQLDRQIKQGKKSYHMRVFIPKKYARIALMWGKLLFPCKDPKGTPDIVTVDIPYWKNKKMLVDPDQAINYLLGSDYTGELKKSGLRMAMWLAKKDGQLGLHAGSKLVKAKSKKTGKIKEVGMILFGLSGTGKSSLTCHHFNLKDDGEGQEILQDDVVIMDRQGKCYGTEDNFYIKTEGLDPEHQEVLYQAAVSPEAVYENIWVAEDGKVDFNNTEITGNGRAVVKRLEMPYTVDRIDLPKAHKVIFITRNDLMPALVRLNKEQAVAAFILGESIETSAGDPSQAGRAKREVGTNPFIVGPKGEEGNIFYQILQENPEMECFVLNTGQVGARDIKITETVNILRELAREGIEWEDDQVTGYQIPKHVEGLEIKDFHPKKYFDEDTWKKRWSQLREERWAWLRKFPELNAQIIQTIK